MLPFHSYLLVWLSLSVLCMNRVVSDSDSDMLDDDDQILIHLSHRDLH